MSEPSEIIEPEEIVQVSPLERKILDLQKKLPGISVFQVPSQTSTLDSLLVKETGEQAKDFTSRVKLTTKISELDIDGQNIGILPAVILGYLIMKKAKYCLKYDDPTEELIKFFLDLL